MQDKMQLKNLKKERRHKRTGAKIIGTAERPRLSVFRSHKHIYAQLVNDQDGQTLISASDFELKLKTKEKTAQSEQGRKVGGAYKVGLLVAEKSLKKNIKKVIFDRGGYKYHGRIKALADGARKGGLEF